MRFVNLSGVARRKVLLLSTALAVTLVFALVAAAGAVLWLRAVLRRTVLIVSVAIAVTLAAALVAAVWAAGGLRADPRPQQRDFASSIDLGRYAVRVTGAVLHRPAHGPVTLDVTLRVTDQDSRSVSVDDLAVNALALAVADAPAVTPLSATGDNPGFAMRSLLHPGVPQTVVLSYGLGSGTVPPGFHAVLVFWGYDHREDFFYGHTQWKQRKPGTKDDPGEFAVPLPIRREGV
jgi:hypothetical protein